MWAVVWFSDHVPPYTVHMSKYLNFSILKTIRFHHLRIVIFDTSSYNLSLIRRRNIIRNLGHNMIIIFYDYFPSFTNFVSVAGKVCPQLSLYFCTFWAQRNI